MTDTPSRPGTFTGILLRFVSCGLVSLAAGAIWRLTRAPSRVGVASALAGILILLSGFILGGLLWYLRDVRLRTRHPSRISDERLAFSFIVFAVVPLAVLILVAVVWLFAVIIGVS